MKYVGESIWGMGFIFKILQPKKKKKVCGEEDEKQVKKYDKFFFFKLLNLDLVLFSLWLEI